MVTAFLVAGFTFLCAISSTVGNDREKNDPVKLNVGAFEYAKELIEQGYSIADGKGAWREHQPLAEKENDSSGFTGLVNMQNGISELTIGTLRIRTEDTNFPVAISKCSSLWPSRRES